MRVSKVLFAVAQANTNDTLQKIQQEESPKLAAHRDAIFLNAKLFARVKSIYDQRDSLGSTRKRSALSNATTRRSSAPARSCPTAIRPSSRN